MTSFRGGGWNREVGVDWAILVLMLDGGWWLGVL